MECDYSLRNLRTRIASRFLFIGLALFALVSLSIEAQAETLRKSYSYEYNRATRKASEKRAELLSRKRFLTDFLRTKFSKEIVDNLSSEIDTALEPADDYLLSFEVVGAPKLNDDETKITIVVEGNVDLPGMVSALVRNKVLSFGERPPKVMFLPSAKLGESPKAAKTLRALFFDKLKQSGLQSVAFEGVSEAPLPQIKGKLSPNSPEARALEKLAIQYNADFLVYVDAEVDNRPASIGGYICDANYIYTVVRPNSNLILGESVVSARGSGNTAMIALDKSIDAAAPDILNQSVGQLFQSIYADSDVIYDSPQLRNSISVTVHNAKSEQVKKIVDALQAAGATVSLGTAVGGSSRMNIETTLDMLGLYSFFNDETFQLGQAKFKSPVVAYAENSIEVEVAEVGKPTVHPKPAKPPAPKPSQTSRPKNSSEDPSSGGEQVAQLKTRIKPAVTFRLRPISYNK